MNRGLIFALGAATLGAAVLIVATSSMLPNPVATHFAMGGRANGWMTRSGYVAFSLGFCAVLPWVVFALTALTKPRYKLEDLRKLGPQTDAELRRATRNFGAGVGILVALLASAMHVLLIEANGKAPATLDEPLFFIIMGVFVAGLLLIAIPYATRFRRLR
jgi:uncharacterized membrane protein